MPSKEKLLALLTQAAVDAIECKDINIFDIERAIVLAFDKMGNSIYCDIHG